MSVNVGTAVGYLDLDSSKFKAGLKEAQSTLSEFTNKSNSAGTRFEALGNSLKTVGSTITTAVSLPLLALGAGAIKVAGDFEAGMSEVSAITGATGNDLVKLENQAKQLGATTKFSARDAAEGMKYFGMAGYDTNQIMSALPATLDLAAAGGTDLGIACDIVSDAMTGLGMSANETTKFTDIMAATITNSNTSVELMGETLKYVGPVAGTLGIEMSDLSVAIGLMGNSGIKGSQAGTALRAGLTNLVKPTKEMKVAMEKYGVELVKNEDGSVDLMGTMENLRSTLGGLDQATQAQAISTIFGKEAMSGWAAIVNASEGDFNKLSEAITNSEGKASDMAKTMQDNLKGSIDNMKSAFEGLLITIGQRLIPIFQNLVEGITNIFTWFNNLNPAIQNVIIGVGGFLAILGPLLLIVGNIIIFITNLGAAIGTLVTFFSAGGAGAGILSAAIGAITGPVGLVIAAITALIAIGVLLYQNWDTIKSKCTEVWNSIKETVTTIWNNIKTSTTEVWNNIKNTLSDVWNNIKTITQPAVDFIKSIVSSAWSFISTTTSTIWNSIKGIIQSVWELIKSIVNLEVEVVKLAITVAWNTIKTVTTTVWNAIKVVIQTVWNAIKPVVTAGANAVKSVVTTVFNAVKSVVTTVWNSIKTVIQTAWNGIKSVVSTGANLVKSTISSVFSTLTNIMTAPFKAAQSVISGILGGITSAINKVTSAISSVTSKVTGKSIISEEDQQNFIMPLDENIQYVTRLVYSDNIAKTSIADSISNVLNSTRSIAVQGTDRFAKGLSSNNVTINNTYNSPKPASIRELKRQDEIQMRRLAMQLGF